MTAATAARPHDGYRHEALLYDGVAELVDLSADFVREGVAAGQPVMVAVAPPRLDALRDALGDEAAQVHLVDMAELGGNPGRIIPAWLDFLDAHAGRPVRGIGEPVWQGRGDAELAECQLHEALLNVAVSPDTPFWLRCPYDRAALGPHVLEEARRSHPVLVEDASFTGSTCYGGRAHVDALLTRELPPPPVPAEETAFDAESLHDLRAAVTRSATAAELPADVVADVETAVYELATNSVRHGGGHGVLRSWREPGALLLEIADGGHVDDPLVGRRTPPLDATGGRGVWLAHQLCDLVQLRSTARGTTVRVTTRI